MNTYIPDRKYLYMYVFDKHKYQSLGTQKKN